MLPHGINQFLDFRIDGFARSGNFESHIPEYGALIDPRSQDSDLLCFQGPGRRHLHSSVTTDQLLDQLAFGAIASDNDRSVVSAP